MAMAERVDPQVRARVAAFAADLVAGRITLPLDYGGPEFGAA